MWPLRIHFNDTKLALANLQVPSPGMTTATHVILAGHVQGCGVRPAIVRAAQTFAVHGWVENTGDQVHIHAQGATANVQLFVDGLPRCLPTQARLERLQRVDIPWCEGLSGFEIRRCPPRTHRADIPDIPPDRAICPQCLAELFDPGSRRYRWPFIACATCGPRYAWLKALPFERANTTFEHYQPCQHCASEYTQSGDRRFGMELIACGACGPQLHYRDSTGFTLTGDCLARVVTTLRLGGVVALQGFTGFHLLALARNENAVDRLRRFKARPEKPLALMVHDLEAVDVMVETSSQARDWLCGEHRPIVLLKRKQPQLWPWVAPDNPYWGVMLPQNGIQALLLDALATSATQSSAWPEIVVATSANRRGEPIAGHVDEILPWLGQGIDAICYHDIPLWQVQDDSVMSVLSDGPLLLRRARGFAHETISASETNSASEFSADSVQIPMSNVLGEGAFLKNTLALRAGARVLVSQYLGDMDNVAVAARKKQVKARLMGLCAFAPDAVAVDAHPEQQTHFTQQRRPIYHHRAHAAALIAEAGLQSETLIAAWDGIGYGEDGQWWGSEVFAYTAVSAATASSRLHPAFGLQPFPLPGGDRCAREPWRVMVALLLKAGVPADEILQWLAMEKTASIPATHALLTERLVAGHDFPLGTSMGRFVEALAALVLRLFDNEFEGQVACRFEYAAAASLSTEDDVFLAPGLVDANGVERWQWQGMVSSLWVALQQGVCPKQLARRVLNSLNYWLVSACQQRKITTLGVSGGCFQNRYLLESLRERCEQVGVTLVRPRRLPPNDGAIAYGQVQDIAR